MEIRELLEKNGFDRDAPIIKGSATKALEGDAANEDAIMELVKAMDDYIPEPKRDLDKPFLMPIEDVFSIKGRGTVATGRIELVSSRSTKKLKSSVSATRKKSVVTGIEMFKKNLDQGQAGDNAGILLRGIERDDIERGQVWLSQVPLLRTPNLTRSLHPDQGRRWPSHAILQGLQASVLLPYN
jgi:elongation factor Tu